MTETPGVRTVSPSQLAWVSGEIDDWQAAGLVTPEQAAALRSRYVSHRRFTLGRVVVTLGACFVGVGVLWIVAANLDRIPPLVRFGLVVALWVGLLVAAEVLAVRAERAGDRSSPLVGAIRLLAAAALGGVVFQAAQSLQLPSYAPFLVGVWGLGALAYAYAAWARGPLFLGVGLTGFWLLWECLDRAESVLVGALSIGALAVLFAAVGVAHLRWGARPGTESTRVSFAWPWRHAGAALALVGVFVAALPASSPSTRLPWPTIALLVLGLVIAVALVVVGARWDRLEVAAAVGALAVTALLSLWGVRPEGVQGYGLSDSLPRAVVGIVLYLAVASTYAALGALRDSPAMTWLATAALVLFVAVQSFSVFSKFLPSGLVFVTVGVVLLVGGLLADRGRRALVARARQELAEEATPPPPPPAHPQGPAPTTSQEGPSS